MPSQSLGGTKSHKSALLKFNYLRISHQDKGGIKVGLYFSRELIVWHAN